MWLSTCRGEAKNTVIAKCLYGIYRTDYWQWLLEKEVLSYGDKAFLLSSKGAELARKFIGEKQDDCEALLSNKWQSKVEKN